MPFIAIALFISVLLGGSAVASQTPQGRAAIESMTSLWASTEAEVETDANLDFSSDTEVEADVKVESESSLEISL